MTSNPAIFEKAIVDSQEYDEDIRTMALEGKGVNAIYETLTQRDVQSAADEFRPLYDKTDGQDGYVSLEVNPHLAHDTNGTVEEARRLWKTLARSNVFIKVPATTEGLIAIQALISEGINVNVERLPELGINLDQVTQQLEDEGVEKFNKPFDKILQTLANSSPRK